LESSLELARYDGKKKLVLDVDLSNNGARRLYERFGFNIFNKKSIPWLGGERGMYNMKFLI
jgi:ribosomal protein S18 acetylase RimI-like enzyme